MSPAGGDLLLQQLLRHRDLHQAEQLVQHLLLGLLRLVVALHLLQPLAAVRPHLLQRVELAGHLGEFVVQLRQLALGDLRDVDLDLGLLVGRGAALQLGGEGRGAAGLQARDGLVDAVEQLAGADGVRHAAGDAVVQHLAVDARLQVDGDDVALGRGPLHRRGGGEALAELLDRLVDVLVGHLDGVDLDADAGVVGDLELGADVDLGGEGQRLVVLQLGDVDLGLAQRLEVTLVDGVLVELRQRVVDGLLQDGAATEPLVDDAGRDLALAEARHRDLLVDLLVRRVEAGLELLEGHLDSEPNPGRVQGLHGALHGRSPWDGVWEVLYFFWTSCGCVRLPAEAWSGPVQARRNAACIVPVPGPLPIKGPSSRRSPRGRGGRIRTDDLPLPKRTRYQAAPHPACASSRVHARAATAGRITPLVTPYAARARPGS